MKRFFLSLCFVAFLGAGLVSCSDEAAEFTPSHIDVSGYAVQDTGVNPGETGGTKKPGGK